MNTEIEVSSEKLGQFYELLAVAGSDKKPNKAQIALRERCLSRVWSGLRSTDIVIDLGCGRGENLQLLSSRTRMALGVDISVNILKSIRKDGVSLVLADARRLPFSKGKIQAVIATEIIEHIPNPMSFLREVHRVLIHDGLLVLSFPNPIRLAKLVWTRLNPDSQRPLGPLSYEGREERRCLEARMKVREHLHEPTIKEVSRMMLGVGFRPMNPSPVAFSFPTPRILATTPLLAKTWHRFSEIQTRIPIIRKTSWNIFMISRKTESIER